MLPALKMRYTIRKTLSTHSFSQALQCLGSQVTRQEMGLQPRVKYLRLGPLLCSPGCF